MTKQDSHLDHPLEKEIQCEAKSGAQLKEKHHMIAEVAAPLFIKKGFHATSIREIAKAAGMSMGHLYHYITSKDDILFLVYRELYRKWEESFDALKAEGIKDPVKRLKALMLNMLRITYLNKELTQMTLRESKFLQKAALKKVLYMESEYIGLFVKTLQDGIAKGVFKAFDPKIMGNFIAYNMFFFPLRSWYFRDSVSFAEVEKEVLNFTLGALLKHSSTLEAAPPGEQ
ncbi:MAG: TetR/AcrR family transcriptional regulator [Pseudomonadota bacterium]